MANYFQLLDRTTGKAVSFNQIDEDMCLHFDAAVDEDKYLCDWYNSIGWRASAGKTLPEIITEFR